MSSHPHTFHGDNVTASTDHAADHAVGHSADGEPDPRADDAQEPVGESSSTAGQSQGQQLLLDLAFWEVELLVLAASGDTREAIAHKLGISGRTVRRRLQTWCEQVGAADVTHLVAWAVEVQLIRLPVSHTRISIGLAEDRVLVWGDRLRQDDHASFASPAFHTILRRALPRQVPWKASALTPAAAAASKTTSAASGTSGTTATSTLSTNKRGDTHGTHEQPDQQQSDRQSGWQPGQQSGRRVLGEHDAGQHGTNASEDGGGAADVGT